MVALVMAARRLSGCRRVSAAMVASAVLALWAPAAMAATNACQGAAGTSVSTTNTKLFNLQCLQQVQIPGKPLQTFGGSTFLRMNSTTSSYLLADRSNLGIDVINGNSLIFSKLLTAKDAVGGFIGQLIWANGPATVNTARVGTSDESHSGPNGLAVYLNPTDANNGRWLFVADGGCNTDINAATYANPASAGNMGACGTPADASTLPNPMYTHANCINPGVNVPSSTVCYPNQHQPNVKLFDLKSHTWVASFPTGGGCTNTGAPTPPATGTSQTAPPPCTAPLGNYAAGTNLEGYFGASKAGTIAIGVDTNDGNVYVLVTSPNEPFQRTDQTTAPPTTMNATCSTTNGEPWTEPGTGTSQGTTSYPYMTLFTMDTTNGHLTYQATIKVDDRNIIAERYHRGRTFRLRRPRETTTQFARQRSLGSACGGGRGFLHRPSQRDQQPPDLLYDDRDPAVHDHRRHAARPRRQLYRPKCDPGAFTSPPVSTAFPDRVDAITRNQRVSPPRTPPRSRSSGTAMAACS